MKLASYGILYFQALRVFVESVLRYGLPVNFQAMVLLPQKKTQKKLRDVLNQQYIHLDSPGGGSSADVSFWILVRLYEMSISIKYYAEWWLPFDNFSNILFIFQMEMPAGLGFSNAEYYPYVYYKVNLDMISSAGSLL